MNLKNAICLTAIFFTATANATNWTDATSRFIKNPAFTGNVYDGWAWESNANTQEVRVECISFYNGNFDLHQQLTGLPKGSYRLTVQGFYRITDNGTAYTAHNNGKETITAYLYAGNHQNTLHSLYAQSMSYNAAGRCYTPDNSHYYPDGKEAALAAFDEGLYKNTLEFEAEGNVTIGVKCSDYQNANYCVLDNFKLEYAAPADENGKSWIDMTDKLLRNPGFDNNSQEGWEWDSDAQSQTARCNSMEFWSGSFNIHQQVTNAPQGKYRLSVQAYYRCEDNDADYWNYQNGTQEITGFMYAGNNEQKLVSVYDASLPYYVDGGWSPDWQKFYPNTMESARVFFDQGCYWNAMEFEAGGDFSIGLYCNNWLWSNWCIFDNFKLEYYGEQVNITDIALTAERQELVVGETTVVKASVSPANATIQKVNWASDNEAVATIDQNGMVTAQGTGSATITATAADDSGVKATVKFTVVHNSATAGSIIINEIMAANVDEYISPAFNFDGWIELYNPSDRSIELNGLRVSDPVNGEGPWLMPKTMGVVPAKGYRLVWFDSNDIHQNNAPFKLDVDGGAIVITDAKGTEIARQDYPAAMERISYARASDGADEWGLTGTPTPGASNNGTKLLQEQLEAPVVDKASSMFSGTLTVRVTIPRGCTLRYTTDGSLPTLQNGSTSATGRFIVSATSNYRFRLFADDKLPSRVTTRSYIFRDRDYTLPVVSVVTDEDFLYSKEIGVMERGPNGRPGNGQSSNCNWNMNWQRPVNFSYLTADGQCALNQDVNLEMCGGWSRAWEPHAFKLKGNKELGGNKNLDYPFFEDKPYIRNRTLQIRNGGNDYNCRFKDPALQYIVQSAGINIDVQSYQPVHEFINGNYIGVLNVREPNNKHFVYANYGWDDDEIDQFEMSPDSGYVQKCGTPDAYNELVDVLSADAANSDTYAEICRVLDIDAYANYMAAEMYLGNWDWPQNNVKGFRHRDGGKFRFVLFDLDGSFSTDTPFDTFSGKEHYTFDVLYPSTLGRISQDIRFVKLFKNMLKNADFRRRFIDAYCLMGGSVYEKSRASEIISQLQDRVEPAMNLLWESTVWTANEIDQRLRSRLSTANTALKSYNALGLRNTTAQRVTLGTDTKGALLYINDLEVPTSSFDGYLYAPVRLKAQAPAGYRFRGWYNRSGSLHAADEEISLPTGTVVLTARFESLTESQKAEQGITPVRINEVSGSNDSYIDEYGKKGDWVELYNTTSEEVDIEGMYLSNDPDAPTKCRLTKGDTKAQTVIPAHGHLVVWCDNKRATTDRGLHADFKISSSGGVLTLTAADQSWSDAITYEAHDAQATIGRYPDGAASVYAMNVSTIGKPNLLTSYMTAVEQRHDDVAVKGVAKDGSSLRVCYGSQQVVVKGEHGERVSVSIYTANGLLVEEASLTVSGESAYMNVSHLAPGFYVARATGSNGTSANCKFMK